MKTETFAVNEIEILPRMRPIVEARVSELAKSIHEVGLLHPITVRVVPSMMLNGEEVLNVPVLVSGRHRLEALKSLMRMEVEANVVDLDDLHAELAEIDENLQRENLSPAQYDAQVARRKVIYETLHPETKLGSNQHTGGFVKNKKPRAERFTKATAKATGRSESSVQKSVARAEKIKPARMEKIVGTSLDKKGELDALAKLPEEKQDELIQRASAGEKVSAKKEIASPKFPTSKPASAPAPKRDEPAPKQEALFQGPLEEAKAAARRLNERDAALFGKWWTQYRSGKAA